MRTKIRVAPELFAKILHLPDGMTVTGAETINEGGWPILLIEAEGDGVARAEQCMATYERDPGVRFTGLVAVREHT
jgi:hypothetical protein